MAFRKPETKETASTRRSRPRPAYETAVIDEGRYAAQFLGLLQRPEVTFKTKDLPAKQQEFEDKLTPRWRVLIKGADAALKHLLSLELTDPDRPAALEKWQEFVAAGHGRIFYQKSMTIPRVVGPPKQLKDGSLSKPQLLYTWLCSYIGKQLTAAECDAALDQVIADDPFEFVDENSTDVRWKEGFVPKQFFVGIDTNQAGTRNVVSGVKRPVPEKDLVPYTSPSDYRIRDIREVLVDDQTLIDPVTGVLLHGFVVVAEDGTESWYSNTAFAADIRRKTGGELMDNQRYAQWRDAQEAAAKKEGAATTELAKNAPVAIDADEDLPF